MNPTFRELDSVVLAHDLPDVRLQTGDLGAIVHVHGSEAFEVEFVTASGRTQNLLRLSATDIRPVGDDDLLAVRATGRRGMVQSSRDPKHCGGRDTDPVPPLE